MMRRSFLALAAPIAVVAAIAACAKAVTSIMDIVAEQYVKIDLKVGKHDADIVDA
jgi:hypothetical protein